MPVLSKEPALWPHDMFANDAVSILDDFQWWVLHTKPRTEKALVRRLFQQNVPFFLPLYEQPGKAKSRKKTSHLPLFPGYVFLRGGENERLTALKTNLVVRSLPVVDQEELTANLKETHALIESGLPVTREERLQPGMQAEITSGPLKGHRGTVIRNQGGMKLIVSVQFIQQGASVEVDVSQIQQL